MAEFKVYTSKEEAKVIKAYAAADNRSVSNLFLHAITGLIRRSKKKGNDGRIISFPEKTP